MKKFFLIIPLVLMLFWACKKSNVDSTPPLPPLPKGGPGAVTEIGTALGNKNVKTIGAAGGTLVSADGKIKLLIPAGALTSNTEIGIQPVTNTTPGGLGVSYHLSPDGTQFIQPVTLTFSYTEEDIKGTNPYFLYIAFQDSARVWHADMKNRDVDMDAKTVSLDIRHFSIWSLMDNIQLEARPTQLRQGEEAVLYVVETALVEDSTTEPSLDLAPIALRIPFPDKYLSNWKINGSTGNTGDGELNLGGVKYTAPAKIDKERTVQISVEVNVNINIYNHRKVIKIDKQIFYVDIKLITDSYSYDLNIKYEDNGTAGGTINGKVDNYTDIAKLQVDVKGSDVNISNIENFKPNVLPSLGTAPDGKTVIEWQADDIGMINIKSVTGQIVSGPGIPPAVQLTFTHSDTKSALWKYTPPPGEGDPYLVGGFVSAGLPQGVIFVLADSAQTIVNSLAGATVVITPRH